MTNGLEQVIGVVSGWSMDRDKLSGRDEITGFCRVAKWQTVEAMISEGAPIIQTESGRWESSKVAIFLWRMNRLGVCPVNLAESMPVVEASEGAVRKAGGNGGEGR